MFRLIFFYYCVILALAGTQFAECGPTGDVVRMRIVGGTVSEEGKWPFMAVLIHRDPWKVICSGVVWNVNYVLTTTSCLNYFAEHKVTFQVYLGHSDLRSTLNETYLFNTQYIRHPEFSAKPVRNDIGLVKLDRPIDFNGAHQGVACVCDPEPVELLDIASCVALGFGRTEIEAKGDEALSEQLRELILPVRNTQYCTDNDLSGSYDSSLFVCAAEFRRIIGTGFGDGGGPLVCPHKADPSKYALLGLTTFGKYAPDPVTYVNFFTKVEAHLEWIRDNTGA